MATQSSLFGEESEAFASAIEAFRETAATGLYEAHGFIDWHWVYQTLNELRGGAKALSEATAEDLSIDSLARVLLDAPESVEVIRVLLALPGSVSFVDGAVFEALPPTGIDQARQSAEAALEMGLPQLISSGAAIDDLLRVALVAVESRRRRFRRGSAISDRVHEILVSALDQVKRADGIDLNLSTEVPHRFGSRRRDDFVVTDTAGNLVTLIHTVFETMSGGRQQRDISITIPRLDAEVRDEGGTLILIADGPGMKQMSRHVLAALMQTVGHVMTVRQAREGRLAAALSSSWSNRGVPPAPRTPLTLLIERSLAVRPQIAAIDLPADLSQARLALAAFLNERSDLALELSPEGDALKWERADALTVARSLATEFNPSDAARLLGDFLSRSMTEAESMAPLEAALVCALPRDPVLPDRMLVASLRDELSDEVVRAAARFSLETTPQARIAALVVPSRNGEWTPSVGLQSTLAANVVIIDVDDLIGSLQGAPTPRDAFIAQVVEQSDLTKVSPFLVSGAVPERAFYGRETEKATLVGTLTASSVALLGGRRIGKTSLMHNVRHDLEQAGFSVFQADCQTVRTWEDFGKLVQRQWELEVPTDFTPDSLFEVVDTLRLETANRRVVVLLDEVDQLLEWDLHHAPGKVPEAFFRTCRTISQEGLGQFVFTGERTIASRLWDAHSPHWNFCRMVMLRQLSEDAAKAVIRIPMTSLQVRLENEELILSHVWEVTNGHPQITQTLGDLLVSSLNERSEDRTTLSVADVTAVTDSYEYREHYLETYWGQATVFERLITLLTVRGVERLSDYLLELKDKGVEASESSVREALRMLELYGIVDRSSHGYELRAHWFPTALRSFGTADEAESRLIEKF